jgi:hypothetical protein
MKFLIFTLLTYLVFSCSGCSIFNSVPSSLLDFNENLSQEQTVKKGDKYYPVSYFEVDELMIESGSVLAKDAIVYNYLFPFKKSIPKGKYPVRLTILDESEFGGSKRVALAAVMVNREKVDRWEYSHSYPVDSGVGCFMDRKALDQLQERDRRDSGSFERDLALMQRNSERSGVDWANIQFEDDLNIIQFQSGYGDGHYTSYIGYNQQGSIVRLVTDFNLIPR